jgi:spore germination protein YaaH
MPKLDQVMCRVPSIRRPHTAIITMLVTRAIAMCVAASIAAPIATAQTGRAGSSRGEVWAFTGPWDPASDTSLARHAHTLDVVVTGWIALDSATAEPILPSLYVDHFTSRADGPARFAIVTSWHGLRFHPSSIRALAAQPARLGRVAHRIADAARQAGYRGLVLDFEDHPSADLGRLLAVVEAITDSAHAHGLSRVAIAVPAADTAAYPTRALLGATDFVLPMLYDEHWNSSPPGPISDPAWVRATLAARIAGVDHDRIIAGLGTYADRWPRGRSGEQISHDAALGIARAGKSLVRDPRTQTLHATQPNGDQLWVNDAGLLRTLIGVARSLGVTRVSLWRLGQEDPAIWRDGVLR